MKKVKRIEYRYLIWLALIAGSIALGVFVYDKSYVRLWQSIKNVGTSAAYYFVEVFGIDAKITTDITKLIEIDISELLPFSLNEMLQKLEKLFPALFVWENFQAYLLYVLQLTEVILLLSPMVVLLLYVLWLLISSAYIRNTDKKGNSKALTVYLFTVRPVIHSAYEWIRDLIDFGREHKLLKLCIFIWLLNLNVVTIVLAALAFYLYFAASFDVSALAVNVVNLLADLVIMFSGLPLAAWLVIAYFILNVVRKNIGYRILYHNEMKNRGFINATSLNNLITGVMRAGKNTTETDMMLSYEDMLRDKALELILENSHKFPNFPFPEFEKSLNVAIEHHQVYNLATSREYVKKKKERFLADMQRAKLYGYAYDKFGMYYNNGMYYEFLFDVLESYSQLWFIYTMPSSLMLSNFAVRSGASQISLGHLPMWENDFFRAPPLIDIAPEDMAHVIDFDAFRLGKKVKPDNKNVGSIEFGVAGFTEKGKERGNSLENQSFKRDSEEANPKNDLYNTGLKTQGHSATVDYYTFFKSFGDEQRAMDINASEREVSMILNLLAKSEDRMTLPFFEIEILLDMLLVSKFNSFFKKYRYNRSDGTLLMYLLHNLVAKFHGYYTRMFNTFGYNVYDIGIEKPGAQDGELEVHKYVVSRKKTYAKRFATDCIRGFHHQRALNTDVGLNDYPTYSSLHPDWETWKSQNSYFVNDLEKHIKG